MPHRLMGLETEFCVRFSPAESASRRPAKRQVCRAILDAVEEVVNTAPGTREGFPHYQRFVQNGGAFYYELTPFQPDDGLLESATPECRSPSQLLLYQRAQEALITRALGRARARLAALGYIGEIGIAKNSRDAKGHVYGAQENYETDIARGWRLVAYRLGLALLVPGMALSVSVLFALVVLIVLVGLVILLVFPLARHWVGLDDADPDEDPPAPVIRVLAFAGLALLSPVALPFLVVLWTTAFREIRSSTMGFLISRTILTGAGTLHDDGTFGLSERAESLSLTMGTSCGRYGKSIFDVGHLLKPALLYDGSIVRSFAALFSRRQRLQLGVSDSNCAQTAEFLKIGTTALVIDMVEAGFLRDAPRVRRPVSALRRISSDPTLRARIALRRRGSMTAIELQRWYLRRAEEFLSVQRVTSLEYREIVTMWRATLAALERDPSSLVGRIDWVTKRALLAGSATLSHAARKKIDIKYHEIGSGYFSMLERSGIAPVRLSAADIRHATFRPPENTPAWHRGWSIAQAGEQRGQMRVSWRTGAS